MNIFLSYSHPQGRRLQSRPMATRTGSNPHKLLILYLHFLGKTLLITALDVGKQSLKCHLMHCALPVLRLIMHCYALTPRAVYDEILHLFRKLLKGRIQRKAVLLTHGHKHGMGEASLILRVHPTQYGNCTLI